jgi:hypothetical protein
LFDFLFVVVVVKGLEMLSSRRLADGSGSVECRRLKNGNMLAIRSRSCGELEDAAVAYTDDISLTESCSETLLGRGKL